jgi:glycerophosphoryl diester phosphodiesterase
VIAHRGACRVRQENTVEAFREAGRMGADAVELDVRRTADGTLAVHHDATLADGRTLKDLSAADLPVWIPDLEAALIACEGMDVNIEIKNWPADVDYDPDDAVAAQVVALVGALDWRARVIVSSFNMATIDRVRALDRDIATGWLTGGAVDPVAAVERVVAGGHGALHPHFATVTAESVACAHDAGLAVNTWTVDDPETMGRLAGWRVDGIVTNVPDVAIATLPR